MDTIRDYHIKWTQSEGERQVSYNITNVEPKYGTNKPFYKTKTDS